MNEPFYKVREADIYDFDSWKEKKLYNMLKKKKDKSWKYWDIDKNPITFEINRLGYRSKTVLPPTGDYFVACGCSNTHGYSLHEEDRYSNLIESETGIPVINLGVPGSGPNFIMMNLFKLINSEFNKPKGVFIQWPNENRVTFPTEQTFSNPKMQMARIGVGVGSGSKIAEMLLKKGDTIGTFSMFSFNCTLNFLKQHKIKNIGFSVDNHNFFPVHRFNRRDTARDDMHMGSITNKIIANHILDEL